MYTDPVYNPNERFTLEALSLLQSAAGVPVLRELERKKIDLLRVIRVSVKSSLKDALTRWITDGVPSYIEPTWKKLKLVLCLIDLDKLANQIDGVIPDSTEKLSTQQCQYDTKVDAPDISSSDHKMECQYCARLFFILLNEKMITYEIHFVITKDVGDHLAVSTQK